MVSLVTSALEAVTALRGPQSRPTAPQEPMETQLAIEQWKTAYNVMLGELGPRQQVLGSKNSKETTISMLCYGNNCFDGQ